MSDLPTGWKLYEFGDLFDVQGGSQPAKKHFVFEPKDGYIRLLQIRDFGDRPVPTYVPRHMVTKLCDEEDILIARYGASLGRILSGMPGAYNVAMAKVILDEAVTNRRFVIYWLNSPIFQHRIQSISRSAQSGFNKDDIFPIPVHLPPLPEQRKIAEILGTWDEAIALTERRIKAARQRQKGLMQRLLTGRVRFPEFEEETWREMRLSGFLKMELRKVPKPTKPYLGLGVRSHGKGTFVKNVDDPDKVMMTYLYRVRYRDLIVSITFAWEGAIALVKAEEEGCLVSHRFPTYTFDERKVDPDFFRHLMLTRWFFHQLRLISPGSAGRNRVMRKNDFLKITISVPSLEEQHRIAATLGACVREIELLTQKCDALQRQKKGLMQRLLTGRVRVKV